MLSSIPQITTYNKFYDTGLSTHRKKQTGTGFLRPNDEQMISRDVVSFKGWVPDAHNAKEIYKIVKLIKDKSVNRIALFSHYGPDGDSIGSMLAFKRMIEQATGKKVDAFTLEPLHPSFQLFDSDNEIKVLSDIFAKNLEQDKISLQDIAPEQVREKFGDYDLAIVLDTPEKVTIDKQFYHLLQFATHKVKIDHHAVPKGAKPEMFNYGEINLVDANKESATLLIMQFAKPLGLKIRELSSKISEALALGVVTDTAQFEFTKRRPELEQFPLLRRVLGSALTEKFTKFMLGLGFKEKKLPTLYDDVAQISQHVDMKKVIQHAAILTQDEFETSRQIKIQFSPNREIGYFSVDSSKLPDATKFVTRPLVQKLIKVQGLKYIFAVSRITKNAEDINLVVIESKDKSIKSIVDEFHGVGHHSYGAIELRNMSVEDAEKLVMEKIEQLRSVE